MANDIPKWLDERAEDAVITPLIAGYAQDMLAKLQGLRQQVRKDFPEHPFGSATLDDIKNAVAAYLLRDKPPAENLGLTQFEMEDVLLAVKANKQQTLVEKFHEFQSSMLASKKTQVAMFQDFIRTRLIELNGLKADEDPHTTDPMERDKFLPGVLEDMVHRYTKAYSNKFGLPLFSAEATLNTDLDITNDHGLHDDVIKTPPPPPPRVVNDPDFIDAEFILETGNPAYDDEYFNRVRWGKLLDNMEEKVFENATREFHFGPDSYRGRMDRFKKFAAAAIHEEKPNLPTDKVDELAQRIWTIEWHEHTKHPILSNSIDTEDFERRKRLLPGFEASEQKRRDFKSFLEEKLHEDDRGMPEIFLANRRVNMRFYDKPLKPNDYPFLTDDWNKYARENFEEYNQLHPDSPAPMPEKPPVQEQAEQEYKPKTFGEKFQQALFRSFGTPHV